MEEQNSFSLISESLLESLKQNQITVPTAVQNSVIPRILKKESLVFQSETGTGKTFAYLLPLLTMLEKEENNEKKQTVKIIICAPTFELASQIKSSCKSISEIKSALFIGGSPIKRQIESLKEKPLIVIGTPARLVELIRLKKLKVNDVTSCVFDEADRLVKKELIEPCKALKAELPQNTQIIACSATIDSSADRFFSGLEKEILPQENILTKNISHWALYAESRDKIETLRKLVNILKDEKILVFTSRADQVENIYSKLKYKQIECMALHAKAEKQQRKAAIDKFRSGKTKILITSDLASRGLDIKNISYVVQMDLPEDKDFFIHRSGRTGRAGKTGINIVIGDEYELRQFALLEKKLEITVYPKEIRNGKISIPQM